MHILSMYGTAHLEVCHHLGALLAQVGVAALGTLQLGLRHLSLALPAVRLHLRCCQLLPSPTLQNSSSSHVTVSVVHS